MGTTWSCSMVAARRASRKKRSRACGPAASSGLSVLSATCRPRRVSSAKYTAPMPPWPSSFRMRKCSRYSGSGVGDSAAGTDRVASIITDRACSTARRQADSSWCGSANGGDFTSLASVSSSACSWRTVTSTAAAGFSSTIASCCSRCSSSGDTCSDMAASKFGMEIELPLYLKDAPALRDFLDQSNQAVKLLPQPTQHAETGLADGIGAHAESSRNLYAGLVLQRGASETLPGRLAEVATHQLQRTLNKVPPQQLTVRVGVQPGGRQLRIGHIVGVVAQELGRPALTLAKIEPHLVGRDRAQPGVENAALALKLGQVLINGSKNLLHSVGGIAVLQTGLAAPGVDNRPVQGAQPLPGGRLRLTGPLQQRIRRQKHVRREVRRQNETLPEDTTATSCRAQYRLDPTESLPRPAAEW